MCEDNYILLNRKIFENNIWNLEPFTYGQAWVDILLRTNHKKSTLLTRNNNVVEIERGECGYSIKALADLWHWSRNKVNTFLKRLKEWKMVEIRQECNHTIIKVLNYEKYQFSKDNKLDNKLDNKTQTKNIVKSNTITSSILPHIDNEVIVLPESKPKHKKETKKANLDEVIKELNLSDEWKDVFQKWLTYKKEEHNDTYKSNTTLKTCIKKVYQDCNGNLLKVKQAIENSIAHTWKGIIVQTNNYATSPRPVMTSPRLEYV